MNQDQLNALFELHKQFPNESHFVTENGVLKYEIWLTSDQHRFFTDGAKMFARTRVD